MKEKYQVIRFGHGMHIGIGIRYSMDFGHEKFTRKISCNFIGTGIGMPCTQEINFS